MRDGMDELEAISDSTKSNNPDAGRFTARQEAARQEAARRRALKASFAAQNVTDRVYQPSLPKLKFMGEK